MLRLLAVTTVGRVEDDGVRGDGRTMTLSDHQSIVSSTSGRSETTDTYGGVSEGQGGESAEGQSVSTDATAGIQRQRRLQSEFRSTKAEIQRLRLERGMPPKKWQTLLLNKLVSADGRLKPREIKVLEKVLQEARADLSRLNA